MYPVNKILESFIFTQGEEGESGGKKWARNFSRTVICFLGCFLSITFQDTLDQFLGVTGGFLGVIIILIVPTLCHYQLLAKKKWEKKLDLALVVFSSAVLFLCTYNGIKAWTSSE